MTEKCHPTFYHPSSSPSRKVWFRDNCHFLQVFDCSDRSSSFKAMDAYRYCTRRFCRDRGRCRCDHYSPRQNRRADRTYLPRQSDRSRGTVWSFDPSFANSRTRLTSYALVETTSQKLDDEIRSLKKKLENSEREVKRLADENCSLEKRLDDSVMKEETLANGYHNLRECLEHSERR